MENAKNKVRSLKRKREEVCCPIDLQTKENNYCLYPDNVEWLKDYDIGDFFLNPENNYDYLFPNGVKMTYCGDTDQCVLFFPNGSIATTGGLYGSEKTKAIHDIKKGDHSFVGVVINDLIINNGDMDDDWGDVEVSPIGINSDKIEKSQYRILTISFSAIAHLFNLAPENLDWDKKSKIVVDAFLNGQLSVVDFSGDETRKPTKKQLNAFLELRKIRQGGLKKKYGTAEIAKLSRECAPPAGFTLLAQSPLEKSFYHRPATSLIFNKKGKETGLFGMDEDSYFGCALPKNANSIDDAHNLLMPEEAKGKDFIRQGEWFFVPCDVETQRLLDEEAEGGNTGRVLVQTITLPLESAESNPHVIYQNCSSNICVDEMESSRREVDEIRTSFNETNIITKTGKKGKQDIYVRNFCCAHVQHKLVRDVSNVWYHVVCNNAVRSVSATAQVD